MKQLYIDRGITESRVMLIEDDEVKDLYIENHDDKSITGNIYKGRVENIVPALNAAFVNIGVHQNAILHFDELKDVKKGQDVLVQVVREPSDGKGAALSTNISIPGKYIVLLPLEKGINVSKKISDEKRRIKLKQMISKFNLDCGVIVRTEAENAKEDEIIKEYTYLNFVISNILKSQEYIKSPKLLVHSKEFYNYLIREVIKEDIDEIIVNRHADFERLKSIYKDVSLKIFKAIKYKEYDFRYAGVFKSIIEKVLRKEVKLKLGGNLIIYETPAFTTIDVNTGKFISEGHFEDTALKTNIEACKDIHDIVKLRNISGIILIDFIKHKSISNQKKVMDELMERFKNDRVYNKVYGFTRLGIMEMTRAKKGKNIYNLIYNEDGEKNCAFVLKEIENDCLEACKHYSKKDFNIYISSNLLQQIKTIENLFVENMKEEYDINVNFIVSPHIQSYVIQNKKNINLASIELFDKRISGEIINFEEKEEEVHLKIKKTKN